VARQTNTCCKLSGLVTEAAASWRVDHLRRYVEHLVETFGPNRLMWGSDWPVVDLAGGYARWRAASLELLQGLTQSERNAVLGGTAAAFYGLG
jgi:L-fuconolactonase